MGSNRKGNQDVVDEAATTTKDGAKRRAKTRSTAHDVRFACESRRTSRGKGPRSRRSCGRRACPGRNDRAWRVAVSDGGWLLLGQVSTKTSVHSSLQTDAFSMPRFKEEFKVDVLAKDEESLQFRMVGIDPALANAFRRILIAEVPTMAIEKVYFVNNTSVIQDEVLAHRLGLVPIRADPRLFEFKGTEEDYHEKNTIVLRLKVECTQNGEEVVNKNVYSSSLEWLPGGSAIPADEEQKVIPPFRRNQTEFISDTIRPVHDDILIARLCPGQAIELEAHCVKGIGREHAKWSPVATAWYKLEPEIKMLKPVEGELAEALARLCPKTFKLIKDGRSKGRQKIELTLAQGDEMELERIRHLSGEEPWEGHFKLQKIKTHFIFTIESTGVMAPEQLFVEAIKVLMNKCDTCERLLLSE